jgi:tripartite-type tricarboxylate transporter receptor subunit TctC
MKIPRRTFLRLAASAAALPAVPRIALAETYPSRPVHIVVGFAAGSASDIVTRLIGQSLSERLGQQFIIENRGGAGGTLGAEAVAHASPDGYTLLASGSQDAVTATLYDKLTYNFLRDIAPVASIASGPLILVVNPSFPAKTVPEFIAFAKANPRKINFGSAGTGSVAHMAPELFKVMANVDMVHVPYRGLAPALNDLLGGQVQVVFSTMPPAVGHIKAGKLRALAVTSKARYQALPDLPTIGEFLPGYEASITLGLSAPKHTPSEIVNKLNSDTNAALADPRIRTKLSNFGVVPLPMTPAAYGKFLADETEKWGKVIRAANIKPE